MEDALSLPAMVQHGGQLRTKKPQALRLHAELCFFGAVFEQLDPSLRAYACALVCACAR